MIEGISNSFLKDEAKSDSLGPARFLYDFVAGKQERLKGAEEIPEEQLEEVKEKLEEQRAIEEGFLTSRPLFAKIKEWAALLAVILPLVIALVEFYYRNRTG